MVAGFVNGAGVDCGFDVDSTVVCVVKGDSTAILIKT